MTEILQILDANPDRTTAILTIIVIAIAFGALITSIVTFVLMKRTLAAQIRHNQLSVLPISNIRLKDYEDDVAVSIQNVGSGPLLIKKIEVSREDKTFGSLIEAMPLLPHGTHWTTFIKRTKRALRPGDEVYLVQYQTRDTGDPITQNARTAIRTALRDLHLKIQYEDIYGNQFEDEQSLKWFGRML